MITENPGIVFPLSLSSLYIVTTSEIKPICPAEYSLCVETLPEKRWYRILEYRMTGQ
jgi:hypothetical protein